MTIEEMRNRKKELGYSMQRISELSGVPFGTVQKVLSGKTRNPRYETIQRLSAVLAPASGEDVSYAVPREAGFSASAQVQDAVSSEDGGRSGSTYRHPEEILSPDEAGLRERAGWGDGDGSAVRAIHPDNPCGDKMQGDYRVEDYLALPDDRRYELIDGVLYEMAAPTWTHQGVVGYLYHKLMSCAEEHEAMCTPGLSPLDVQLDRNDRTMVQPDVILLCDPTKIVGGRVYGAPDFVAEVVSPSSGTRDRFLKLYKYKNAGVREYWIIDPKKETVTAWVFDPEGDDDRMKTWSFADSVPVAISEGLCRVCFNSGKNYIDRMTKAGQVYGRRQTKED